MEYREYYCGDMTIPEEKRGEFTQRVLTIMDHGGLMATEKVRLCGRELTLLAPPRLDAGNNVCVDFSYFEYAKYDPIHYNADTARMSCGYMDAREFSPPASPHGCCGSFMRRASGWPIMWASPCR